jgi:peptide/nickel transport system ATP-binding protein
MNDTVFELDNVSFSYGKKLALSNIDLRVLRGESLGIVGESGSGKTTLLMLLLRLLTPSNTDFGTGSILFCGNSLNDMKQNELGMFRRKVQPVFQDPFLSLDPSQTIMSIVGEPLISLKLTASKTEYEEKIVSALQSVGFETGEIKGTDNALLKRFPHEFSGGQRQRIAIARALATEPQVLIADEPVSALDIITKSEILTLLKQIREKRKFTLIFVSHDLPVVAQIAEHIVVMDRGRIVEDAAAETLLSHPQHEKTKKLIESCYTL